MKKTAFWPLTTGPPPGSWVLGLLDGYETAQRLHIVSLKLIIRVRCML